MSHTEILYHTLDDPLNPKQLPGKYSDLHSLYPGRPMDSSDNFDRYNIEHEEPDQARQTFIDVKDKTASYGEKLEKKSRKAGGGEKMTVHAIEDPSMIIEDPALRETNMLNPSDAPLLMPLENQEIKNRFSRETPLIENYGKQENTPAPKSKSYKWLMIILASIGLFIFAYFYSTRKIDIYSF